MRELGSIAEIRMGATLRGRDAARPVPNGRFRLVRINNISRDGKLLTDEFDRISPSKSISQKSLLKLGDVLFPNRGDRTTACVFNLNYQDTLAGAQFFILRPFTDFLMPEYLAWYLRGDEAGRYFAERRTGTNVKTLPIEAIENLPVPLPPLPVQRRIVEISELQMSERSLMEQIIELKTKLIHGQLLQAAKSSPSPILI